MLQFQQTAEALRIERATSSIAQMAERRGIAKSAMKVRLSYYGVVDPPKRPRIERLMQVWNKAGTPREMAVFIGIHHRHFRRLARAAGLLEHNGQMNLFPVRRSPIPLRVVHLRRHRRSEVMPLSLFEVSEAMAA